MKRRHTEPPTIERLIELQAMLLQFRAIERTALHVNRNDTWVAENDTEHSYDLAMAAWFLAPHFPELDGDKLIRYSLAHDLIEIHAGDTSVFADDKTLADKPEREAQAAARLATDWADFPELIKAIHDYESKSNEEAKFVYALDKVMPIILNITQAGRNWHEHKITLEQLHAVKKDKVRSSPPINVYYEQLYELLLTRPEYFHQPSPKTTPPAGQRP